MLSRLVLKRSQTSRRLGRDEARRWLSAAAGPDTYYDSQSGQHVKIHDESKIQAYWRWKESVSAEDVVRMQTSNMQDAVFGALVMTSRDEDYSLLLHQEQQRSQFNTGSSPFALFFVQPSNESANGISDSNINLCFEYTGDGSTIEQSLADAHVATKGRTSIGIFQSDLIQNEDPVLIASGVASLIDNTGGGEYIILSPTDEEKVGEDEIIQLCEELSYLDVAGSTIKSRLIVSAISDDQIEECLGMGISKYFVHDAEGLDTLRDSVEEQGKQLSLAE